VTVGGGSTSPGSAGKASPGSADKASPGSASKVQAQAQAAEVDASKLRQQSVEISLRQQTEVALNTQQQQLQQSVKAGSVTVETAAIAETITKGMVAAVEIGVRNALSVLEQKTA
jgi:hypothetical protein